MSHLQDTPLFVFAALMGCAVLAAGGVGLLALALYGFFRWCEIKKAQIARMRRRKKRLHYKDML